MLDFRAIRETWKQRLTAHPTFTAWGLTFEDIPATAVSQLDTDERRGFVALDDERVVDEVGDLYEADLLTVVLCGTSTTTSAAATLETARRAVIATLAANPSFGGQVGFSLYAGSTVHRDGQGARVYSARSFTIRLRGGGA